MRLRFAVTRSYFPTRGALVNREARKLAGSIPRRRSIFGSSRVKHKNGDDAMAAAKYTKGFMPLHKVKEKEFLSRPMGCRAVGFSLVRDKPGPGTAYVHRHKMQEEVFITLKGTGSIILDGKRISMPEGIIIRVAPTAY
jgi:mannose-6-phosphate isomerase-like protein (cupin superfamily)